MRSAALCLLAIAAPACNWVFGIEETLQVDAPLPIDAARPPVRLTWLLAVTDTLGIPVGTLEYPAISPAPTVEVGRLGEPLIPATIDDNGTILLPEGYEVGPSRLVYQLADGPPREIQWSPTLTRTAHAVVPVFGRLDPSPIPGPNTVVSLTPSNGLPNSHMGPIVYTTGVWTQSLPTFGFPGGATFNHNLNQSVQLGSSPGAPDHTKGDLVVLVDYSTVGSCRLSTGSAAFKVPLMNGVSTPLTAEPWRNTGVSATFTAPAGDRVRVAIAASAAGSDVATILQIGPGASATMPAFTQKPGAQRVPLLALNGPLMFPMLDCVNTPSTTLPVYNLPDALSTFPQLAHIQVTADRTVAGGPRLPHGLVGVRQLASGRVDFDLNVGIPLPPFMLGTVDLSTMDDMTLPAGSDPLVLTFMPEPGTTDYYEVLLHEINGTSTEVKRIYTMTEPALTIDRSVFTKTRSYVFEIRAFNGAPDARSADFAHYTSTQSSAVVWTHTFVAQ